MYAKHPSKYKENQEKTLNPLIITETTKQSNFA